VQPVHPAADVLVVNHPGRGAHSSDYPEHHTQRRRAVLLVRCCSPARFQSVILLPLTPLYFNVAAALAVYRVACSRCARTLSMSRPSLQPCH
jgi:hypothetical protein